MRMFRSPTTVLFVLLVVAALVTSACSGGSEVYKEIKERGTLIVGTSADYAPWEYVDEAGDFAGYDIELIREIGERMDLEVEIQDMGFDTLISALKQGKIDVVIAAMSITEKRLEQVDFTDGYYDGAHGFIVKSGSGISLSKPEELADYTVGVQTGTTHEEWIITNLVDEGEMSEDQISRYEKADQGALDVKNGRIDVFIADLPAAKGFVESMSDLEIALEYDLTPGEPQAIAVPKGADDLCTEINKVLEELKGEGFLDGLQEKHLIQ